MRILTTIESLICCFGRVFNELFQCQDSSVQFVMKIKFNCIVWGDNIARCED